MCREKSLYLQYRSTGLAFSLLPHLYFLKPSFLNSKKGKKNTSSCSMLHSACQRAFSCNVTSFYLPEFFGGIYVVFMYLCAWKPSAIWHVNSLVYQTEAIVKRHRVWHWKHLVKPRAKALGCGFKSFPSETKRMGK